MQMKQVRVGYCDGTYWLEEWKLGQPIKCIEISEGEWDCYQAFAKLSQYWHDRCRTLGNEQYELDHPTDIAPFEAGPDECDTGVALTKAINAVLDEDMLDREDALEVATGPLRNPTIIEAANEPVKTLTGSQITTLEKMGWTFMMTGPSEWGWIKFVKGRTVAVGGDAIWARDVKAVTHV